MIREFIQRRLSRSQLKGKPFKLLEWLSLVGFYYEARENPWPVPSRIFRIFLSRRPYMRNCLIDYTRAQFYGKGKEWVRFKIMGFVIFERNHRYSGLPGARGNG